MSTHEERVAAIVEQCGNMSARDAVLKYAKFLVDYSEEDVAVRKLAKRVLSEQAVEGDSYGVPALEDIVELLVAEVELLRKDKTE